MDLLLREISDRLRTGQPFSVGTVIHTSGSTPQKTGARALFLPDGTLIGTLGGGCMEAEARRRGLLLTRGGDPDLMELHLDDDFGWDDGLICGGTAHIFLQPRPGEDQTPVFEAVVELQESHGRGVLVLVAAGPDAAVGRYMLVRDDGSSSGGLGDPALETEAVRAAMELLGTVREDPRRLVSREHSATLYLEPLLPKPVCFIAGAGHIGAALCHFAARAGFRVAIVDDRASLCNPERLPDAERVIVGDIVETVRNWPKTPHSYFVVVTRGHRHDAVVLRELVHAPVPYVGMIGSKRKILTIYEEFIGEGLASPDDLARIYAPIGLDIGALSVDEIALCIAAELIAVRRRGPGWGKKHVDVGERDRAGGRGVPANGSAEAALATRLEERDRDGRPLTSGLPDGRRRERIAGGAGTSGP